MKPKGSCCCLVAINVNHGECVHGSVIQPAGSALVIDLESPPRPATSAPVTNPDAPWSNRGFVTASVVSRTCC